MPKCNTSKDNSVLFWHDNWLQDTVKSSFPKLYSFTKKPKCSLRFFVDQSLDRLFHLPLSIQASNQLTDLQAVLQEGVWDPEEDDYWVYSWGSSTYNSRKAYKCLQGSYQASPLFSWLWSAGNLGKHKFFFWLLLRDRLKEHPKTENKFLEDYNCVICSNSVVETRFHLFFECPFSSDCWNYLSIHYNISLQPLDMVIEARLAFGSPIFREFFVTACWIIWTTRNRVVFYNASVCLNSLKVAFKHELGLVCTKAKSSISATLSLWRERVSCNIFLFVFWAWLPCNLYNLYNEKFK